MTRTTIATITAAFVLLPRPGSAQDAPQWSFELATGPSFAVDAHQAFNGTGGVRMGVGVATSPTVRFRFLAGGGFFSYDRDRFADLFELEDAETLSTGLGATVIDVAAEAQWSPWAGSLLQPTVGGGLALQRRDVGELVGSPVAWARCSPFHGTPDPDCAQLREDMDIDGVGLALQASAGVQMVLGSQAMTLELGYAHGFAGANVRFLTVLLGFRSDF